MSVSSKCYYALRAVYALADHAGPEPLKIAEIAEREQIPIRFLEVILNQLKGGGFVQSRRGAEGGYRLARPADQLTVGEIMRYIDGPIAPVDCVQPDPTQGLRVSRRLSFLFVLGARPPGDLRRGRQDHLRRPDPRKPRARHHPCRRLDHLGRTGSRAIER